MSRFLLEPCNKTLSHFAQCLAPREMLEARCPPDLPISRSTMQPIDSVGCAVRTMRHHSVRTAHPTVFLQPEACRVCPHF
jgi:hypothetical protein